MAQPPAFRRFALPGLLGGMLLCHEQAHAQQQEPVQLGPNEQVMQAWQQDNPGGATASLVRLDDGSTRLEWKAGGTLDTYSNSVQSAGGNLNTPLRSGAFYSNTIATDLRAMHRDNTLDYLQFGMTHSNDPAVLSLSRRQVNNLQLGRSGPGYLLAIGDIAPNFSSLGSALAARGLYGQRQFDALTVSGFTGLVADSWEALEHRVPRNQPLRDVHGVKLEQALGPSLRTYVTSQGVSERAGSGDLAGVAAAPGTTRSASAGFQYESDQFALAGETARSRLAGSGSADRSGDATVVDARWRVGSIALRAGSHAISTGFLSLSAAAQPGIREAYAGIEWTAAAWAALSGEVRRSRAATLATAGVASTSADTDSVATGAVVNFGPDHPGWSLAMQHALKRSTDAGGRGAVSGDFSSTVSHSNADWNASLGYSSNRFASAAAPETDSHQQAWSLGMGRVFSGAQADPAQAWSIAANVAASAQQQRLASGGAMVTTGYSLALRGQHAGWGAWNLLATGGAISRPDGGARLRQRGLQFDASRPVLGKGSLKAYLRSTQRNAGDALLASRERVAGVQFAYDY
jgi:hypothetical protein